MASVSETIDYLAKENKSAHDFFTEIFKVAHFFDDLIDKDKELIDADIHEAMTSLLFSLPMNKFYSDHESLIRPILIMSTINWRLSTGFERNPTSLTDLNIAFILRSSYVDLLSIGAVILHGETVAMDMIAQFRRDIHDEGFDGYLQNLEKEYATRESRNGN
jgi:hypothetical protein